MSNLSTQYKPDFIDHFPVRERGGSGKVVGRATNAANWMRDVSYNGPSPGIAASREEKVARRVEEIHGPKFHCDPKCVLFEIHSVCRWPVPAAGKVVK